MTTTEKRKEGRRLGAALGSALQAPSRDTQRLDWLQRTQTSIGYNVEAQAWGVDFEAPLKLTIREAIDAAIAGSQDICVTCTYPKPRPCDECPWGAPPNDRI